MLSFLNPALQTFILVALVILLAITSVVQCSQKVQYKQQKEALTDEVVSLKDQKRFAVWRADSIQKAYDKQVLFFRQDVKSIPKNQLGDSLRAVLTRLGALPVSASAASGGH